MKTDNSEQITVMDILGSPFMKGISRVVAGRGELDRLVKWVHVIEIGDMTEECAEKDIMVLTTGSHFDDEERALNFVRKLIDIGVTALCIETVLYCHEIGEKICSMAEENGLVLVEICEPSSFLDISRYANTMILVGNRETRKDLEMYKRGLESLGSDPSLEALVRYTGRFLKSTFAFVRSDDLRLSSGKVYNYSDVSRKVAGKLNHRNRYLTEKFVAQKVSFPQIGILGYLIMESGGRDLTSLDLMVMEQFEIVLGEQVNKVKKNIEGQYVESRRWICEWLRGQFDSQIGLKRLQEENLIAKTRSMAVLNVKMDRSIEEIRHLGIESDFVVHDILSIKKAFLEGGIISVNTCEKDVMSFILYTEMEQTDFVREVEETVQKLVDRNNGLIDYNQCNFALGLVGTELIDLKDSSRSARSVIRKSAEIMGSLMVYEQMKLKLMVLSSDAEVLQGIVQGELKNLVTEENCVMYETLQAYLKHNCNKQRTAEELYISRQTLYSRLQRLDELLGRGYDEGERRFTLELAVRVNNCLKLMEMTG